MDVDKVTEYAKQVTNGSIITCEYIRLACKKHIKDLQTAQNNMSSFYFDQDQAQFAIDFFKFTRHSKGEWAGAIFELEPWQEFIVGNLFGWKRKEDDTRRYRTAYIEIPRKNGKSTLAAGVGLYMLIADREPGAEVFAAATKKDQAKLVFEEAKRMVKSSPALRKRIKSFKNNLNIEELSSKFEPLGADADSLDGLNVHAALVDELHAHKNSELWDVLDTATGSRRQPLIFAITTAGFNQTSICYELREYAIKNTKGVIKDDTFFSYIATIDEGDDWTDPKVWEKANPNYGISVKEDDFKRLCNKAKEMPSQQNNFLTKRLNVWTQQAKRWINLSLWDENSGMLDEEKLKGNRCYGGLDLSSVSDLTAWVMVFPDEDDQEKIDIIPRLWCPESKLYDKSNKYMDQYKSWHKQGFLKTTPGDAIDYEFIKHQIIADSQKFDLIDMNIDRLFQGYQLSMELEEEGLNVATMGMGFMSMATPMKEFERRLLSRKVNHGGNPVLRWMADSLAVKTDPAGNVKPDKASSQGKIDGIVALIMGLDRAIRHEENVSIYNSRGLRSL